MKRKITMAIIAATTLVLSAGTMSVFATEPARGQDTAVPEHHGACGRGLAAFENGWTCGYCGSTCHFLDEDGDGLCDYHAYRDSYQYDDAQGYGDSGRQAAGGYDSQEITDNYGQGGYGGYCGNYDDYGYCGGRGGSGHHGGYGNGGHHGHHGR